MSVDPVSIRGYSGQVLMSADEFADCLREWDLTIDEFAMLTGYNPSTIRGWGCVRHTGRSGHRIQVVPKVVCRLLDAWALNGGPPRPSELTDAGAMVLLITPGRRP